MRSINKMAAGAVMASALALAACGGETRIVSGDKAISTVSLSATAKITATPDQAFATTGVTAEGDTADAAMKDQAARMSRVVAELKKAGIEDRDITTSGLNLSPNYSYDRESGVSRIIGYRASNQVTVLARDMDKVGPMLDALVRAGANEINSIQFRVSDADERLDEARAEAAQKVKERAELYAKALGVKVVRVVSISEGGGYRPEPMFDMAPRMAMTAEAASTPIAAGDQELSATVNATFEIE